jgi:hypothetical protein
MRRPTPHTQYPKGSANVYGLGGQVMEEGRLRTSPEAFRRRFASEQQPPMRIAIEAGTHSPWASRVLEECGHEVPVANTRNHSAKVIDFQRRSRRYCVR